AAALRAVGGRRDRLAIVDLAEQDSTVGQLDPDQGGLPEVATALPADPPEQADDEQPVERQRAATQRGHRQAGQAAAAGRSGGGGTGTGHGGRVAHSCAYRRRRRCRTSSANVLTTKVRTNRISAARKSVRYRVPPCGASGISTAMLADRVRKPLNGLQSRIGVLP